ncbi:MAG: DUF427 domain-containing protein [Acidimicrobiia bacterium]|nr:DUF427 domain-containing protein [Acidimicrobiia bacterium]MDX2468458.1 DUF427 domain-containing protein [Acidimicrobiia bacterium]
MDLDIQESVWDFPRPPAVECSPARIRVVFGGATVADSISTLRVLETSHPPAYYLPLVDVDRSLLRTNERLTLCEFKGTARYYDVVVGDHVAKAGAWFYPRPARGYGLIAGHVAFYAAAMDECWVDNELVTAQPGEFYGGWITSGIEGPFKRR